MSNELGRLLAAARDRANMTQEQVAAALGIKRSAIAHWETGRSEPTTKNLLALAGLYGITPNELLGLPTEARIPENLVEVPVVAEIPAGRLVFTEETVEGYRGVEPSRVPGYDAGVIYFFLRVVGDCMMNRFHNGDYALVRQQDTIEDGELAIIKVGEQATMKRVKRHGDMVALSCDNPPDPRENPILLPARKVRIIGKVVGGEWGQRADMEARE